MCFYPKRNLEILRKRPSLDFVSCPGLVSCTGSVGLMISVWGIDSVGMVASKIGAVWDSLEEQRAILAIRAASLSTYLSLGPLVALSNVSWQVESTITSSVAVKVDGCCSMLLPSPSIEDDSSTALVFVELPFRTGSKKSAGSIECWLRSSECDPTCFPNLSRNGAIGSFFRHLLLLLLI